MKSSERYTLMGKKILECKNITIQYNSTHAAAQNVSFDVERGDCLLIVGRNGSGKSTLLKGILGLVPLKEGSVAICDELYKKCIGYLPQQSPFQKDFPATVNEVVMSGFIGKKGIAPFYNTNDKRRCFEILSYLGIPGLAKKSYRELSGGERQRVLLARALCSAIIPESKDCDCSEALCGMGGLLILDEPSNGLDPMANRMLYNTIKRLNREQGMTVIMVSHLVGSAIGCANKILHMETSAEFFGSIDDYKQTHLYKSLTNGGVVND